MMDMFIGMRVVYHCKLILSCHYNSLASPLKYLDRDQLAGTHNKELIILFSGEFEIIIPK